MAFAGFLYLGWVLQVWPLGGCGFRATSPCLQSESAQRPSAGQAGLVAGMQVGQAFGVLLLPGFGVSSSSPQVPGHPTSICDAGVKIMRLNILIFNLVNE